MANWLGHGERNVCPVASTAHTKDDELIMGSEHHGQRQGLLPRVTEAVLGAAARRGGASRWMNKSGGNTV
jgi:hypothetical protein